MANVLRAHPDERDDILTWLQQNRGNAFTQQVKHHLGQVESLLPPGAICNRSMPRSRSPGNRKLGGDWTYAAKTQGATSIHAEVSTKGVQVWLQPSLHINITFPGRDADLGRELRLRDRQGTRERRGWLVASA